VAPVYWDSLKAFINLCELNAVLQQTNIMQSIGTGLLYFLALGVAAYAIFSYGFLPLGTLVHPDIKASFLAHPYGIYIHAFASVIALAIGPFQFSANRRKNHLDFHRWLGRIYLIIGVLVGGLAGLYMSQYAFGGLIAKLGFATLAILWIYTGLRAYLAIRQGHIEEHRKWMVRNFSLTFAAVTLRLYLPVSTAMGVEFAVAYPFITWLCWVPNLMFAEWRYNLKSRS